MLARPQELFLVQASLCISFLVLDRPWHVGANAFASLLRLFLLLTTICLLQAGACGHCPDQKPMRQRQRVSCRTAKGYSSLHEEWLSLSQSQRWGSGGIPRQSVERCEGHGVCLDKLSSLQRPQSCTLTLENCSS